MAVIKIQLRKDVRRYADVNVQLNRIYNFIFKKFENVPSYFELQYRHPMTKIRRQLRDNEQLAELLQLKQSITLLIRPIAFENISRYQISRSGSAFDICDLLENLSLQQNSHSSNKSHQQLSQSQQEQQQEQLQQSQQLQQQQIQPAFAVEDDSDENYSYYPKTRIVQDNQDFLIKDETHEYIDLMYAISDDSSPQIEISFD